MQRVRMLVLAKLLFSLFACKCAPAVNNSRCFTSLKPRNSTMTATLEEIHMQGWADDLTLRAVLLFQGAIDQSLNIEINGMNVTVLRLATQSDNRI